ncbi:DUF4325 domain-containing protein [Cytophaga sp. FL35]|uniref:STAS-like domain-containing protein n=1 Tax=Cytophaga sp. FL35 TaxID=1904456 RepID=UPI001653866C|nr:DUF4325 domain-containing protein [Cytophaga sp. FL35]MBC7000235.1 STAS-like domain-containing protein [Cytophaga sp. FL35]
MILNISTVINQSNAISHSDGLRLYDYVITNLKGKDFILSFGGINRVSTAFLNASIGKLFVDGYFSESFIDKTSTKEIILKKIESVISNAKNPDIYNQAVNDAQQFC